MSAYYTVGKIVNTQGLKGEVRIISTTDFAQERYKKGSQLTLFRQGEPPLPLTIATYRKHKQFDVVSFEGYPSINDVEAFKNGELKIEESQLHELEEDEFYYHQIVGLRVQSEEGEFIGTVKEILSPGANDVWVVENGKSVHYIPYIEPVVLNVDISQKTATIRVIEGLLDE